MLDIGVAFGECHFVRQALANRAGGGDSATERLRHEIVDNMRAQAAPTLSSFGGEECVEQTFKICWRETFSVILVRNNDILSNLANLNVDTSVAVFFETVV